jgi:hypothetical protein
MTLKTSPQKNTDRDIELDPTWAENNLEYDLRSNDWICKKVKSKLSYAQNLYAALCNNKFIKNEIWAILNKITWSCSWRYAAGIVSDMCEQGDYMDWYCSGSYRDDDFVKETVVTDEIRQDLFALGWITVDDHRS